MMMLLFTLTAPAQAADIELTLLPQSPAYRENATCSEIAAPPIERMPHTEGDYAICFAYGSSDMIAQRIGEAVSPLDLATGYFLADADRLLRDSRRPRRAPAVAEDRSIAADIALARAGIDVTNEFNPNLNPYVDRMEGGEERYAVQIANMRGLCRESDLPSIEGFRDYMHLLFYFRFRALAATRTKICRKGLFGLPAKLRDDIADSANIAWLDYVDRRCNRFNSPVPLKPVTYRVAPDLETLLRQKAAGWTPSPAQKTAVFARIDYALDHKRYPVIGYSYEVFEKRLPSEHDADIDHSSVIVARKKIHGACHYLVQDDSGENCIKFYPELRDRCTLGRVWLTRQELLETLHSVTYLR